MREFSPLVFIAGGAQGGGVIANGLPGSGASIAPGSPVGIFRGRPSFEQAGCQRAAVLRGEVRQAMDDMRKMISAGWLPEPTDVRKRCEECEYANYCGDVW